MNGWMIFCTHQVERTPSRYGTSIDDLVWLVAECKQTGGEFLTVEQACGKIAGDFQAPLHW
jgi:hypothetical protein